MAYTEKFHQIPNAARAKVEGVAPQDVDAWRANGAIAQDFRD